MLEQGFARKAILCDPAKSNTTIIFAESMKYEISKYYIMMYWCNYSTVVANMMKLVVKILS